MTKVIILDYITGQVTIVHISDKVLDNYNENINEVLINEYEFYHPECEWMVLSLDEFGNFEVNYHEIYER